MSTLLTSRTVPAAAASRAEGKSVFFRWGLPILGVFSLLASCVIWSLRKPMWGGEVFSWTELRDPSLLHLLGAAERLGGAGMPLFYLTAWPWAHLFGTSDLSLRLYSSAGVCAAFLVLLMALRRHCSGRAAFLGTAFGLFASLIVLDQNSEARGYGLYLFLASLAIAQALRIAATDRPRAPDLLLLALSQAGLVLGHILGLVYAGLILLALLTGDLWQRRFRLRVYLAAMAGWLALVPWIPAIQSSAAVGRPHGWIAVPTFANLASSLSFWLFTGLYWQIPHLPSGVIVAGWLCAVACIVVIVLSSLRSLSSASPANHGVVLLGLALLLAPVAFFLISHVASPIFLPRYLVPSALGVSMLASCAADRARIGKGIAFAALSVLVLLLPIATALLAHPTALDVARVDQIASGRPVLCDTLKDFLVMTRYTARPSTPRYPLDAEAASTVPGADTDVRLMQNYGREGYFAGGLLDVNAVLSQDSFLVLDNGDAPWFRNRIESNPQFVWKTIARIDGVRTLMEVQRKP